jgi:hypothetical protein
MSVVHDVATVSYFEVTRLDEMYSFWYMFLS